MRFYLSLTFIIAFCINAQAAEDVQARSAFARAVQDTATWDFNLAAKTSNWVIAELTPQAGYWEIIKEPRAAWDGKTTLPDNTPVVWIVEGTLKVLTPLTAAPKKMLWLYHYEKKGTTFGKLVGSISSPSGTEGREIYSPFYHQPGGIVICSIPDSILNAETANPKYQRAYLIPDDAQQWIVPAQTFYTADPELFSTEKVADNGSRLLKLIEDENPFLFAAAFRTLAQSGSLDTSLITKRLIKADRLRQAIFTYLLLSYSPSEKGKALVEEIQHAIGDAPDSKQFEGVAIGAYLAYGTLQNFGMRSEFDFHGRRLNLPEPPPSLTLSKPLIRTLLEKQKALGVHTETDKYLFNILTAFPAVVPEYTRTVNKGDHVEMTRIGP